MTRVPGAGLVRDAAGQGEDPVDHLFAQAGQGTFAEAVGDAAGPAGQQQLGRRAAQYGRGQEVDTGDGQAARLHPVDDAAEEPGAGRPGEGGEAGQHDGAPDGAGVLPDQLPDSPADRRGVGDRQAGRGGGAAHRASPSSGRGAASAAAPRRTRAA
ncbi:hypothetical protein M2168_000666 [Streptomyces sp. CZ24]|nr:hypothetical protein [Streptomyces sp. CZ24]